jgi:hypothetical protein
MIELTNLISEVNTIIPQIADFITQFHSILTDNSINIITDADANMSMEVPNNMPDSQAMNLKKRLEIIDRLISTKAGEVENLLDKGSKLELAIKKENPEYKSVILDKLAEFNKLKSSYKHY